MTYHGFFIFGERFLLGDETGIYVKDTAIRTMTVY